MDVADPGQGLGSILRRMLRAVRSIGALRFLVLAWGSLRNSLKVFGASVCRVVATFYQVVFAVFLGGARAGFLL